VPSTRRPATALLAGLAIAVSLCVACAGSGRQSATSAGQAQADQTSGSGARAAQQPAPQPAQLRLHLPSRSTSYLPWYIAIERGYFKEQSLEVEIMQAPGTIGVKAMVAGEMDFSGAATSAIPAIAQGTPLKVVFVQSAKPNYWFTTRPEIQALQDLKGIRVVVPNLGGSTYERLLSAAMRKQGLDPSTDVTFIGGGSAGGGGSDILVAALAAGLADGMVGNVLQRLSAEEHGFHTIYDFANDSADIQGGVATSEGLLRDRPDVAQRFFRAAVKATRVMAADPDTSLDVLIQYVEMDRGDAAKGLSWIRPLMARDGLLTPAEQADGLAALKAQMPEIASLEVSQVFDLRPLEEAVRAVDASGWQPR